MSQSQPPEGSSPIREERVAMQGVRADEDALELDRQKSYVRQAAGKLFREGGDALRAIGLGLEEQDDHRVIEGLRKLLAVGVLCKPTADQLEGLLPQPKRLF